MVLWWCPDCRAGRGAPPSASARCATAGRRDASRVASPPSPVRVLIHPPRGCCAQGHLGAGSTCSRTCSSTRHASAPPGPRVRRGRSGIAAPIALIVRVFEQTPAGARRGRVRPAAHRFVLARLPKPQIPSSGVHSRHPGPHDDEIGLPARQFGVGQRQGVPHLDRSVRGLQPAKPRSAGPGPARVVLGHEPPDLLARVGRPRRPALREIGLGRTSAQPQERAHVERSFKTTPAGRSSRNWPKWMAVVTRGRRRRPAGTAAPRWRRAA